MIMKVKGEEGHKKISLNTNALESKINAIQIIYSLAENMGKSFVPFVDTISQFYCKELLSYQLSIKVRRWAMKTLQFLLFACPDKDQMKLLFTAMSPFMLA